MVVEPAVPGVAAIASAFKELEPIPQFRATAKLCGFLTAADAS
jgi:hypothetical protein